MGSPAALTVFQTQFSAAVSSAEQGGLVPYNKTVTDLKGLEALFNNPDLTDAVEKSKLRKKIQKHTTDIEGLRRSLLSDCEIIYQRALVNPSPFVLGGVKLRSSSNPDAVAIMKNFGILAGTSHQAPQSVARHMWGAEAIDLQTGGILSDGSWSVFKNDCAMLGIIHAGRTCYVSNLRGEGGTDDLIVDLWEGARPKVLGREIAMLYAAKYRQVTPPSLISRYGHVFVPTDRSILPKVTLEKLIRLMDKVKSVDKILAMLAYHPDPEAPVARPHVSGGGAAACGGGAAEPRTPVKAKPAPSPGLEDLESSGESPFSPFEAFSPQTALEKRANYSHMAGGGGGFRAAQAAINAVDLAAGGALAEPSPFEAFSPAGLLAAPFDAALPLAHEALLGGGSPAPLPSPAAGGDGRVTPQAGEAVFRPLPRSPDRNAARGSGIIAVRILMSNRALNFAEKHEGAAAAGDE